ncbi:hypothetical protein CAL15_03570 [Bordetella genomosp. 13]|uniref:Uncharacterized protein n=1 Tax=Bordetella genomosp. 13 TaxID=463040 RepID=A0A1W6Z865_9BORD|nr:hypothetical protein CAL15_03570 [Bordetella genomosp. 13]
MYSAKGGWTIVPAIQAKSTRFLHTNCGRAIDAGLTDYAFRGTESRQRPGSVLVLSARVTRRDAPRLIGVCTWNPEVEGAGEFVAAQIDRMIRDET